MFTYYKETIDHIQQVELETKYTIPSIQSISKGSYIFKVHNVGQAQAVSLCKNDGTPIFYFDFGLPCYKNKKTKPENVSLEIGKDTKIIISHLDQDHWCGISEFIEAYKCDWYIPCQKRKIRFSKVIADIILSGKNVYEINNEIISDNVIITCDNIYGAQLHQSGLTCRINGINQQILVMGDQRYDCVSNLRQLQNVDTLVASHHGGTYSTKNVNCIPDNTKNGLVVYSYGSGNSYGHPSKVDDYKQKKWCKSHETINGDYEKKIDF